MNALSYEMTLCNATSHLQHMHKGSVIMCPCTLTIATLFSHHTRI